MTNGSRFKKLSPQYLHYWMTNEPSAVEQVLPPVEADGGVELVHLLSVGREVPALHGHLPVSIWLCFPSEGLSQLQKLSLRFPSTHICTTKTSFHIINPALPATTKVLILVIFWH